MSMRIVIDTFGSHSQVVAMAKSKIQEIETAMPVTCIGVFIRSSKEDFNSHSDVISTPKGIGDELDAYSECLLSHITLDFQYNKNIDNVRENLKIKESN